MEENKEMQMTIPYIAHEAAQARAERQIKRQSIAIVIISLVAIIALFLTAYLIDKGWRDYLSECEIQSYSISSDDGGNANFIGQDGDIINGKNTSKKNKP